ncbi:RND family transporter [Mycolicibacterium sp. 050232]|uniref:MMPL/RND family transporter n=1 Tax=Mycolicibacterium sp. 050232 TaxID=3113982 RepID=UPI002E27E973|nr:RND family transporter [Mycolicibacterium sp. 050232]MED5814934.1 RND family transporter [Mycolicibacterium sp. 050232]
MSSQMTGDKPPFVARMIRVLAVPIIIGWLLIAYVLSALVPPLEQVEKEHSVSLIPNDAPSFEAVERMGKNFGEATSNSSAIIVLEGDQPLGDEAHRYYNDLVRQLRADPAHIQHVQDFWGDPLMAGAAQSADSKAVFVQMGLAGALGQPLSNESLEAVRAIVDRSSPPPGVKAYVTGPAAMVADLSASGNKTVLLVTGLSLAVILAMLLIFFRSIFTAVILLFLVGIQLQVARGVVALLADSGVIGLSTYAVNLLVTLGIAAGTDYGIFFVGRYQEARQAGEDKEQAFYTTYRSVGKVVLGSGLTIAGAVFCLSFTRLPYFRTLGVPCALGMIVAVAVALTLIPAVLALGSRLRLFEPKRKIIVRRWRRIGTAIVRWPAPILVAACAVSLIGLLALPAYQPGYSDQEYLPKDIPANAGYDAAARHFQQSLMASPDILLVEADRDMRNPADFLVLNKLAKGVLSVPGVARVQSATRPEGIPLKHTTIPFIISSSSAGQVQLLPFQKARMNDLAAQADEISKTIAVMQRMYGLMQQLAVATSDVVSKTHDLEDVTLELRDHMADFDDFWRPVRNYLYWEPHCFNIPLCWSTKSLFEALDGVDKLTVTMHRLIGNLDQLNLLLPQMIAQFPAMIATMQSTRTMMLTMRSTMGGIMAQMEEMSDGATAMGKAFDNAQNDDSFYIPPTVFKNADFKRVMDVFLSPDGKTARLLITQRGDPATPEGIARVNPIRTAAEEALKGTPLENAKIYLTGTSAMAKDQVDGSNYDLLIAGIAALCLIFIIMLIMIRSLIAALVIVGTVALSLGAAFGLSVLIWQHILGMQLNWIVLAIALIILLAVGSDYNLLLVSRMKEEIRAGVNTGIIRAMAGSGKVVTAAGLVFAATMFALLASDLRTIGQVGSTIGIGLLFDTLVVRAFMTPSIAALLGRWFWWPLQVRQRPASALLRPTGPRPLVRSLLLKPDER